jgi:hypothetical protein
MNRSRIEHLMHRGIALGTAYLAAQSGNGVFTPAMFEEMKAVTRELESLEEPLDYHRVGSRRPEPKRMPLQPLVGL